MAKPAEIDLVFYAANAGGNSSHELCHRKAREVIAYLEQPFLNDMQRVLAYSSSCTRYVTHLG